MFPGCLKAKRSKNFGRRRDNHMVSTEIGRIEVRDVVGGWMDNFLSMFFFSY